MASKTNCVKNGTAYYRLTATIGKNSDGKPVRKDFYGKCKRDAEAKKAAYLLNLNSRTYDFRHQPELGETMHIWLFDGLKALGRLKPSTFQRYESIFRNYIVDTELYRMKPEEIRPFHIQCLYNDIYSRTGSRARVLALHSLLRAFFCHSVNNGYIAENPCSGKKIILPGRVERKINKDLKVFTDNEIKKLVKGLSGHPLETLFITALGTGLRQGELLALCWNDIDLENSEISVFKSLRRVTFIEDGGRTRNTVQIMQSPKSASGIRNVPFSQNLKFLLKAHKLLEMEKYTKSGVPFSTERPVFTNGACDYLDARNVLNSWKRALRMLEIDYKCFHCLRHTYATKLFEQDIPLKTVQTLLGHSDINTTANIYTHVMQAEKAKAVQRIDYLLADS